MKSILDDPAISGRYLFPQTRRVNDPFLVKADGAELAYYCSIVDPDAFILIHFHGNGEAVADYTRPLLTLHTENDGLIDISHAERNHKWAGSRQKRLVRFSSGNHNTIFGANEKEYLDAIGSFARIVQQ